MKRKKNFLIFPRIFHTACGLEYLSSKGIFHRDLALRNLLITSGENSSEKSSSKYVVKVADFGLAKIMPTDTSVYEVSKISEKFLKKFQSASQVLPVRWCSPETLEKSIFNNKSDVYSFGVTLWEFYTFGKLPWEGMTNSQVEKNKLFLKKINIKNRLLML